VYSTTIDSLLIESTLFAALVEGHVHQQPVEFHDIISRYPVPGGQGLPDGFARKSFSMHGSSFKVDYTPAYAHEGDGLYRLVPLSKREQQIEAALIALALNNNEQEQPIGFHLSFMTKDIQKTLMAAGTPLLIDDIERGISILKKQ